jgi:hypothetical protein
MRNHPASFIAGVMFIAVGAAFLGDSLGWWSIATARLWPLVLIAVGGVMILNASRLRRERE